MFPGKCEAARQMIRSTGRREDKKMLHLQSDYMEGAHPRILERLTETNLGKKHRDTELIFTAAGLRTGYARPAAVRRQGYFF